MKQLFVVALIVGILLLAGCTGQGGSTGANTASPISGVQNTPSSAGITTEKPAELKKAICGNGIKEAGETSDNCCKDAGCPATFKCSSKFDNNQSVQFCEKVAKSDTFEAGKIKGLMADITEEINKEGKLADYSVAKSKLSEIQKYSGQLKEQGYDVATEEYMYKVAKARIDVSEIRRDAYAGFDQKTFEQQKEILAKDLPNLENIIATLDGLKTEYSANLKEAASEYGYDIDVNLDSWKSYRTQVTALKEKFDKGIGAELSITDVSTSCYRYSTLPSSATLSSVKIKLANTGGFDFGKPTVDMLIYSAGNLVADDKDNTFWVGLKAGETKYEEISAYITKLECDKPYTLKVQLRDGADPKVYASTEKQITID